jgi:hypothetical protein
MSVTQVLKGMVEKASKKDVGIAIKIVAAGIFILLLGICLSLVLYGQLCIDVKSKPEVESAK